MLNKQCLDFLFFDNISLQSAILDRELVFQLKALIVRTVEIGRDTFIASNSVRWCHSISLCLEKEQEAL